MVNKIITPKSIMLAGVVLGLLTMLISSCSKSSITILSAPTCSPPCWQNITPGKSSVEETKALLGDIALVDKNSIVVRGKPWDIFDEVIYFKLRSRGITADIYFLEGKVSMIVFSGDLDITLGKVVVEYGEPEYIANVPLYGGMPLAGTFSYGITAFESEQGLAFAYDTRDLPKKLKTEITPDIRITLFFYFDPGVFSKLLESGLFFRLQNGGIDAQKSLMPWTGYGNIEEKYPPAVIE
jgi:hypothetical protein